MYHVCRWSGFPRYKCSEYTSMCMPRFYWRELIVCFTHQPFMNNSAPNSPIIQTFLSVVALCRIGLHFLLLLLVSPLWGSSCVGTGARGWGLCWDGGEGWGLCWEGSNAPANEQYPPERDKDRVHIVASESKALQPSLIPLARVADTEQPFKAVWPHWVGLSLNLTVSFSPYQYCASQCNRFPLRYCQQSIKTVQVCTTSVLNFPCQFPRRLKVIATAIVFVFDFSVCPDYCTKQGQDMVCLDVIGFQEYYHYMIQCHFGITIAFL